MRSQVVRRQASRELQSDGNDLGIPFHFKLWQNRRGLTILTFRKNSTNKRAANCHIIDSFQSICVWTLWGAAQGLHYESLLRRRVTSRVRESTICLVLLGETCDGIVWHQTWKSGKKHVNCRLIVSLFFIEECGIEPFRQEIEPGIILIGAPLGTNIFGFSFIKIRDVNNQEYQRIHAMTRDLAENVSWSQRWNLFWMGNLQWPWDSAEGWRGR